MFEVLVLAAVGVIAATIAAAIFCSTSSNIEAADKFELYAHVSLKVPKPAKGLSVGEHGVVVLVYHNANVAEVEFDNGNVVTLKIWEVDFV